MEQSSSIPIMVEQREVKIEKEELPKGYGETRIFLLPRDPWWAFTYWEVTEQTKKQYEKEFQTGQLTLRLYDVTGIEFDGTNAHKIHDIAINPLADNWYINVPEVNRSWCVDYGVKMPDGSFVSIARSNVVHMPRYGVSALTDEQWAILHSEFERLLEISGVSQIGKGSFDVAKLMRQRWEEIVSISSLAVASPMGIPSWFAPPVVEEVEKKRGFWLKADTELVVYGQTEPTAEVKVAGKKVHLYPDGSFSLRFSLAEGTTEIPVESESQDKLERRQIKLTITRKTE